MKTTTLDADEYFHLALHASSVGDPHACISYLEEVLQLQPANARALYLRAVQHTELGLTDRAVSGIREALAIDPALEIARFHLGLLLLFDRDRAKEAMEYLHELRGSSNHDLRRYAQALEALVDHQFPPAREKLALGLAMLSEYEPHAALATLVKRSAP